MTRFFLPGVLKLVCALVGTLCVASEVLSRDLLVSWSYEEPMLTAAARRPNNAAQNDLTQVPSPFMPDEIAPAPAPLPPEPSNSRMRGLNRTEPQLQPHSQPQIQTAPQSEPAPAGNGSPTSGNGCAATSGNGCAGGSYSGYSYSYGPNCNGACNENCDGTCRNDDCAGTYNSACCDCGGDCCNEWYFNGDAIFLWRDNRSNVQSIVNSISPTTSVFNTRSLDFDTGIGPSFRIGHRNDQCTGWEVQYYSALNFTGEADVVSPGNLAGAGQFSQLGGWNNVDQMHTDYTSELHNVEINYQRTWGRLSLLAGFRYVRLTDDLGIRATTFETSIFGNDYRVHSENNLFGAQLGGRYRACYSSFFWEMTGKAGVFGNDANQGQFLTTDGSSEVLRNFTSANGTAAFVGDFNISAGFQLSCAWAFRCGYNLLWIDQVALAADQLDFNVGPAAGSGVDKRGDVFLHGINIGFEGRW